MTSLNPDPFMVSLVQTATVLPMFLLTLLGGVIADVVDPRRFLIINSLFIALFVATFAAILSAKLPASASLLATDLCVERCMGLECAGVACACSGPRA